jgi:hypothetical protein
VIMKNLSRKFMKLMDPKLKMPRPQQHEHVKKFNED